MTFDWDRFENISVLAEDPKMKYLAVALHPSEGAETLGVALIESLPLDRDAVLGLLKERAAGTELIDSNDIYYRFINRSAGFDCRLIYPAKPSHLAKYSEQERRLIPETPHQHDTITRPFFQRLKESGSTAWVDNILNGKDEQDKIILSTDELVLLFDSKWTDMENIHSMYLLAIVRHLDLTSVRDLDCRSLPMLIRIRQALQQFFSPENSASPHAQLFKFPNGQALTYENLRVYFHYPPTYPHLHLHVVLAGGGAVSSLGAAVGQAILLDDVIENIQLDPSYYTKKRTLVMQLGVQHELYKLLR